MANEIPVKTVGVLLVAVALLAIMGTFIVVSRPVARPVVTGMGTGTGTASVQMAADTAISTPTNSFTFTSATVGGTWDSTTGSQISIQNDGNTNVNVSINHSTLWTNAGGSPVFKAAANISETSSFDPAKSTVTYTAFSSAIILLGDLEYDDASDLAELSLQITVPTDEPEGTRSATIDLVSVDSTP